MENTTFRERADDVLDLGRNMIRRLGGRRWNLLHRLIYLTAIFGVIHYLWLVKADTSRPIRYGVIIGALLLARLFFAWRGRVAATRASTSARLAPMRQ